MMASATRFLEVPIILVGPMLGWMCYWAFVDGRSSRLAVAVRLGPVLGSGAYEL
jgi:hypothetical protein